ncbi:HEPN domain-containing protein [Streptomyces anulatus]|uniref:HEPN domain-containing protein n=1 Tax=Streptomyces anulatus TaxID=1892 RepID=UPI003633C33B
MARDVSGRKSRGHSGARTDGKVGIVFFLARQLAEHALKALIGPEHKKVHDLETLLEQLAQRNDDLLGPGAEQLLIAEFFRDLHRIDPKGDEGRYPASRSGTPALAAVCCANPALLCEYVTLVYLYTQKRIAPVEQPV